MCRVLKVVLVAPPDRQLELKRAISSISYDVVAVPPDDPLQVTADVAIVWEPASGRVEALHEAGLKVVAVGGEGTGADLALGPDELGTFRERVWELLRP